MGTKILRKILAIICIISIILPISSEVLAALTETSVGTKQKFGISLLHQSKLMNGNDGISFGYALDSRKIYRIYYGESQYDTTILCLDIDGKFPQEVGNDGTTNVGEYTSLGEATVANLKTAKSDIDETKANKIQWLIKNALLPEDSENLRNQKLAKIFNNMMNETSTTVNPLTLNEIKEILTEDDVVIALQIALWQITNNTTYQTIQGTSDGIKWDGVTSANDMWGFNGKKGEYIQEIVNYYNTQLAGNLQEDTTTKTNPSFNETTVTTTIEGSKAFIGPFNIKSATNYYTIDIFFEDASGNAQTVDYVLLDKPATSGATALAQTKESLEGKDFYIAVNVGTKARKVKFQLNTQVQTTSAIGTVWTDGNQKDQPLLSIQRQEIPGTPINYEKDFEITVTTNYDVALRKYISAVKRKTTSGAWKTIYDPTNSSVSDDTIGTDTRVPVKEQNSSENAFNDYNYLHRKDPLEVQVGDMIVYSFIMINECSEEVAIKNITDYLPPSGLIFLEDEEINKNGSDGNYWQYNNSKNAVVTNFNTMQGIILTPGEAKELKLACQVTEDAKGKVITNIAEITGISSADNMAITDEDSAPSNLVLPTTEKEWEEYNGNESSANKNKDDLSDENYYYKGQEDDDDFEKVKVAGTIDLALRKSITTVNGAAKNRSKQPDTSPLRDTSSTTTTSIFSDIKTPVSVKVGDIVVYTIRIFNEGQEEASAGKIEDYIPEGLGFIPQYNLNIQNGWIASTGSTSMKLSEIPNATSNLSQSDFSSLVTDYKNADVIKGKTTITTTKLQNENIAPYDETSDSLSSKEVQVACVVLDTVEPETVIKNIAAITEYRDDDGNVITNDIDSDTTTAIDTSTYPADKNIQDDDDFEKLILKNTIYDLALKKFITNVTSADGTTKTIPTEQKRELIVTDVTQLVNRTTEKADAVYQLNKTPVDVAKGDYVTYTIRIYNEGLQDGIVNKIIDTVPEGLEFVTYEENSNGTYKSGSRINQKYGWKKFNNSTVTTGWSEGIETDYLSQTSIPAFEASKKDEANKGLSYVDVQVEFKVVTSEIKELKNIAEIAQDDGDDNDSTPNNKIETEDDQDYDVVIPIQYDLALKKYITGVTTADGKQKTIPEEQQRKIEVIDVSELADRKQNEKADAEYDLNKTPVEVTKGDYITYTIRVYNEGLQDAKVKEIVDTIPEGLEFVSYTTNNGQYKSGSNMNYKYGWKMYDESGNETDDSSKAETIKTTYLNETSIPAFDSSKVNEENKGLSYAEVQVEFKVITNEHIELKNIAEITDDDGDDNDSTPDNQDPDEDDEDYDIVIPIELDLALRKFITQIDDKEITDREPEVEYEEGEITYSHTKEPIIVVKGQTVIYTLRVYNQGTQEGYAAEIKDDLPEGITFLPEHETNIEYGWKMYDKSGKETENIEEAVSIRTAYLSKEASEERGEDNLLKAFDSVEDIDDENPDYRDIKVAFEVTLENVTEGDKIIINTAEISKDEDKDGNEVDDADSIPDNDEEDEDDIDKEYIELRYFDLSLLKYVSKVVVTEDGVVKETETGYDGTENPEPVVKVELNKKKLDKTEVKYVYSIKITNEGEIEGYATEITDRIPEGLAFYEEDNKDYGWKIKEDGIVTTDYLKEKLLQPGESETIQIILRWEKSENNLGQKVNVAEISDDDNPYDVPDIDSTPNNDKDGEDDQDEAIVVLSINTGSAPMYIVLTITIMSIFAAGFYLIYKYVVKK